MIDLCVISGGNWNNGSIAGVWCANLNNNRGNSNNNVGFRADCGFTSYPAREQWSHRDALSGFKRNHHAPLFLVGRPNVTGAAA